jgi:hypothetical protein
MKPRNYTRLRHSHFTQRAINPWNKLPERVVQSPSLNIFKWRLDIHWATKKIIKRKRLLIIYMAWGMDVHKRTMCDFSK